MVIVKPDLSTNVTFFNNFLYIKRHHRSKKDYMHTEEFLYHLGGQKMERHKCLGVQSEPMSKE